MTADQFLNTLKGFIASLTSWLKIIAGVILAVLLTATLSTALGHPIPYVPALKGSMQEIGVFTAALAYWLSH